MTEPFFSVVALRAVFDLSFFIIVTTLGLNIVVAILVDRFSELREERVSFLHCYWLCCNNQIPIYLCVLFSFLQDKIKDDQLNFCFVCSINNDTFERKGKV